jgi:hypothetical protein
LSGTAVVDSTLSLFDGTGLLGTASADVDGAWTFEPRRLSDTTGNLGETSSPLNVTVNAQEVDTQVFAALALMSSFTQPAYRSTTPPTT